jgi:hypothetical protein
MRYLLTMDPSVTVDLNEASPASLSASLDATSAPKGATWLAVRNPRPQPLRWLASALSERTSLAAAIERLDVSSDSAPEEGRTIELAELLNMLPRLRVLNIERSNPCPFPLDARRCFDRGGGGGPLSGFGASLPSDAEVKLKTLRSLKLMGAAELRRRLTPAGNGLGAKGATALAEALTSASLLAKLGHGGLAPPT